MATSVSDTLSNAPEQIEQAAKLLIGSSHRRAVFSAVYAGKSQVKSPSEISAFTGLNYKQVLNAGKFLRDHELIHPALKDNRIAYRKVPFFSSNRDKILRFVEHPEKLSRLVTKRSRPRPLKAPVISIRVDIPKSLASVIHVTVDHIDSFDAVRQVEQSGHLGDTLSETAFKLGVQQILGESGEFKDWGGEGNDLFTAMVRIDGKRITTAFAFKGPAKSGKLTPGGMGKNGDQIQRLAAAPARLLVVQYVRQMSESILQQLEMLAMAKSYGVGEPIRICQIDGIDSKRLVTAYADCFRPRNV